MVKILTDHEREMQELANCQRMRQKARLNRPWYPEEPPPQPEQDWNSQQWEQVTQLKAMVRHLQKKVLECQKVRPSKIYGKDIL